MTFKYTKHKIDHTLLPDHLVFCLKIYKLYRGVRAKKFFFTYIHLDFQCFILYIEVTRIEISRSYYVL